MNYPVKPSQQNDFNYTQVFLSKPHQTSLEIREYILYRLTEWTVPIYKKLAKPSKTKWRVSLDQLSKYPEGSLGRDWHEFYQQHSFDISPNYEEHDICHVILGYRTSIVEETRMYSFLFGTGKRSIPTLLTIIIGCIALPEFIRQFYLDYTLGKSAINFSKWDFRHLLHEPTSVLRKLIFQKKI